MIRTRVILCVGKFHVRRYDRFEAAVDRAFAAVRTNDNWNGAKEDVAASLRQWYRATHAVSAMANAQDMSAILEAYWTLAAKVTTIANGERSTLEDF